MRGCSASQQANPAARQVLSVARLVGGSDAAQLLQPGDMLLAIDGKPVTQFRDVERAVARKEQVQVTVWRADGEKHAAGADRRADAAATSIAWCSGPARRCRRRIAPSARSAASRRAAFMSRIFPVRLAGVSRYGLVPGRRIVEVDGQPTPDLDAFLRAGQRARRIARRCASRHWRWNGAPEVITLKLDRHYWPAYELRRTAAGWERQSLE